MTTRRILVTGANKGIGRALIATILEHSEDTTALLGARDPARGHAARETLCASQPGWRDRIAVVPIDVSDDASVAAAAASLAQGGPLHGLVNNAGVGLGANDLEQILAVNTFGPKRVFDACTPLLEASARVVNISSASGPNFIASCEPPQRQPLTDPAVTWRDIDAFINAYREAASRDELKAVGLGSSAYGLSKACLNAYTVALARDHSSLIVNACTPGFIETDMTRPYAESRGVSPEELGMKAPREGTRAAMHLLFGEVGASGWYFGSDGHRSPLDRYRAPGAPPYTGT